MLAPPTEKAAQCYVHRRSLQTTALDTEQNAMAGILVIESGLDVMQGYPIVGCVPVQQAWG